MKPPHRVTDGTRTYLVSRLRTMWPKEKPHIYWSEFRRCWIVRYMRLGFICSEQWRAEGNALYFAQHVWEKYYGEKK